MKAPKQLSLDTGLLLRIHIVISFPFFKSEHNSRVFIGGR